MSENGEIHYPEETPERIQEAFISYSEDWTKQINEQHGYLVDVVAHIIPENLFEGRKVTYENSKIAESRIYYLPLVRERVIDFAATSDLEVSRFPNGQWEIEFGQV